MQRNGLLIESRASCSEFRVDYCILLPYLYRNAVHVSLYMYVKYQVVMRDLSTVQLFLFEFSSFLIQRYGFSIFRGAEVDRIIKKRVKCTGSL